MIRFIRVNIPEVRMAPMKIAESRKNALREIKLFLGIKDEKKKRNKEKESTKKHIKIQTIKNK